TFCCPKTSPTLLAGLSLPRRCAAAEASSGDARSLTWRLRAAPRLLGHVGGLHLHPLPAMLLALLLRAGVGDLRSIGAGAVALGFCECCGRSCEGERGDQGELHSDPPWADVSARDSSARLRGLASIAPCSNGWRPLGLGRTSVKEILLLGRQAVLLSRLSRAVLTRSLPSLPARVRNRCPAVEPQASASGVGAAHERERIEAALAASQGRISGPFGAAIRLGVARQTLESRIRALGVNKHREQRPQTLGRGVNRRGQPRRAAAQDEKVVLVT